jgi:hypothetical protein
MSEQHLFRKNWEASATEFQSFAKTLAISQIKT